MTLFCLPFQAGSSAHEQLLINLGWLSVRNILAYELGVFMFKAVNKLAPEEINNLFMKQYEIHNHGTRSVERKFISTTA